MRYSETQQAWITIDGTCLCMWCRHDKISKKKSYCAKGVEFDEYGINRSSTRMCKFASPKDDMIRFYEDEKELDRHIGLAKKHSDSKRDAIVVICKNSEKTRNSFYAFYFEPISKVKVGEVQRLEDGSVRRVEYIEKGEING